MSTLPRGPNSAAAAEHQAPVVMITPLDRLVDEAVSEFESGAEWLGAPRPSTAELRDLCRTVALFTTEIFPDGMAVKVKNDPELADDIYFVFDVIMTGSVDDIVARFNEWHSRLLDVPGARSGLCRLSIHAS